MIIITTTNKIIQKHIERFKHGSQVNQALFIDYYGLGTKNNKSMTFVLKDDGVAWCYVAGLKKKYPDEVHIFHAKDLWFRDLPKIFQQGGTWLAEKPRNIKHLPKALGLTEKELKSIKLEDVKKFFKIKGYPENKSILDKIKSRFK
jgi:hypothetical protein